MRRLTKGAGFALASSLLVGAMLAIGCSGDEAGDTEDASKVDAHDGTDGGAERDANGPGADGETCSFNYDCQVALRCECDGECTCKTGTRGGGKSGGGCDDGNDCASAVCLEGPNDELLCSDECKTADDCPEVLPLCQDIAFVGRICTRTPPL